MVDSLENLTIEVSSVIPSAAEHLKCARDGICRQIDPEVDSYIRNQLGSIVNVAHDASFLAKHFRFQNLSALCRLAFESRIHFLSAIRIEGYVARKFIKQAGEHIAILKTMTSDNVLAVHAIEELKRHETYLQEMLVHYSDIPTRNWNLKEAAEALGLLRQYDERYAVLSQAIHCTPAGLTTKDDSYIVAYSIVHLLSDILDLIEFTISPEKVGVSLGPLTEAWVKLFPVVPDLLKKEADFLDRLNKFSAQKRIPKIVC